MAAFPKRKITKRKVSLTATFVGDGRIRGLDKKGKGSFSGGVPEPKIKAEDLSYVIAKEYKQRNGLWNPRDSGPPVKGGFQINITGTARGYRQLAEYFLSLAEIDSRRDEGFHEHLEEVWDAKGNLKIHLIFRKTYRRKNKHPSS